jgi:hypothetical protein
MQTIRCSKIPNFLAETIILIASLGFTTPVLAIDYIPSIWDTDGTLIYLDSAARTAKPLINDSGR